MTQIEDAPPDAHRYLRIAEAHLRVAHQHLNQQGRWIDAVACLHARHSVEEALHMIAKIDQIDQPQESA